MRSGFEFSNTDREDLERRGIRPAEGLEQLAMLDVPPPPVELLRACHPGDGIAALAPSRLDELEALWDASVDDLRVVKFVPASGAATRMFSFASEARAELGDPSRDQLRSAAGRGSASASRALELAERRRLLPFAPALERYAAEHDLDLEQLDERPLELAELIAGSRGLGLADLPKGLLPFHLYDGRARTAFEEHLREAAGYAVGRGQARVHFTVTPEHRARFEEAARRLTRVVESASGVESVVEFSVQDPSSDTLALEVGADGERIGPLRSRAGRLVFRPSGHGALIANLGRLDADVVFIKNIDNIAPERRHEHAAAWKKRLGGHLLALRRRTFDLLDRLERTDFDAAAPDAAEILEEGLAFCRRHLALRPPASIDSGTPAARRAFLLDRLDRPLRVCGVVENVGEPGGGPFWLPLPFGSSERGESGQIVETSQIDLDSPGQAEILASSTHFNPVDLVCSLRDRRGRAYDLTRFTDPRASFVAHKKHHGRPIRALERPGLWNGAMAGWNTAFVEVPLTTFTPVKTILDLARPEHRTAEP